MQAAIPRFATTPLNTAQIRCIQSDAAAPLVIVAGPGSGKTTVLVLRALRLIFVDGLLPEEILLTTFTRKAAGELRSRLIERGLQLLEYLRQTRQNDQNFHLWLDNIDINRFVTGTLDSVCEEALTIHRDPSDAAPVLVEGFVGNALLIQQGLFPAGAYNNAALAAYLTLFTFDGAAPPNFGATAELCRQIIDRLVYDEVDVPAFSTAATRKHRAGRLIGDRAVRQFFPALSEKRLPVEFEARLHIAGCNVGKVGHLARPGRFRTIHKRVVERSRIWAACSTVAGVLIASAELVSSRAPFFGPHPKRQPSAHATSTFSTTVREQR